MPITITYAGILALIFLALSVQTIRMRTKHNVNLGDGGNPAMQRIMRGHANFAEYVPLILILMALLEGHAASRVLLNVIGATLLAGRLFHGYTFALTEKWFVGRVIGASLTLLSLGVAGVGCLVVAARAM